MAIFTNVATLTYDGTTTTSNTVTGELLEVLSGSKTAVLDNYRAGDPVTYVIALRNTGATALTNLTVTDDLGAYTNEDQTLVPLSYVQGSATLYVDGTLQAAPAADTTGGNLVFTGLSIPAGSDLVLIYEARPNGFAPLAAGETVTNTATVTGGGLATPLTLTETVTAQEQAQLTVSKALSPGVVTENGQLTYTFVIQNTGNSAAAGDAVLRDTFDPILDPITVTFNGAVWTAGTNYTYDTATGEFATLAGQITVPAATYTRNADGSITVVPGTSTLVVTGTV